jgi:hypothetical protein
MQKHLLLMERKRLAPASGDTSGRLILRDRLVETMASVLMFFVLFLAHNQEL